MFDSLVGSEGLPKNNRMLSRYLSLQGWSVWQQQPCTLSFRFPLYYCTPASCFALMSERERGWERKSERHTKREKDGGGVGGQKQLWDPFTCKWLKELPLIPERTRATPPLLPLPCQFPLPLLLCQNLLVTWLCVTHSSNAVRLSRNHAMLIEKKWKTNRRHCCSVSEPAVWERGLDKALKMMTWHIYHKLLGDLKKHKQKLIFVH